MAKEDNGYFGSEDVSGNNKSCKESNNVKAEKELERAGSNSRYTLKTLEEAEDLAHFLANCFPDCKRALGGLLELLINAVEHGNLEISYDEKTEFIDKGIWREEIQKRQKMQQYKSRKVSVFFNKTNDAYKVKIMDEGKGFQWRKYMKVGPSRSTHKHGRGIAQANMVNFDRLKYNKKGNEVVATIYVNSKGKPLDC